MTRQTIARIALIGIAAAMVLGALMWFVVMPRFLPEGAMLFDAYVRGITFDQARDLMRALGDDGRWTYRFVQIPLDMVFLVAYALGLGCAIMWLQGARAPHEIAGGRRQAGGRVRAAIRSILFAAPFLAAVFDFWENVLVFRMLGQGEGVALSLVNEVSRTTTYKWVFLALTAASLALSGLRYLARGRSRRRA